MTASNPAQDDYLNAIGRAVLAVDTRWLIIAAIGFLALFGFFMWLRKGRFPSRDEAQSLGLALLQLYSAPVLFALLVLTQPPAFELVGSRERQGAGLLASIFLVTGLFMQVKKIWSGK